MTTRLSPRIHLSLTLALAAWSPGCRPATGGDPEFWAPAPGAEGAGGNASSSGGGSPAGGGTGAAAPSGEPKLTVAFTTVSFNGEYEPDNIGAVWVADEQDVFVKSLEVWAAKRIKYLVKWKGASGGNTVDAITGATWSQHGSHQLAWDVTDVGGNVVPDGVYRVYVEFTEQNGAGKWTAMDFMKGDAPVESTPPDLPHFTGQRLVYTP